MNLNYTRQVIRTIDSLGLDSVSKQNLFDLYCTFCRISNPERALEHFQSTERRILSIHNITDPGMPKSYVHDFNGATVRLTATTVDRLVCGPQPKPVLRDFTKSDWYGFAGAEEPTPGVEPKITEVGERTIVVDIHGITIMEMNSDGEIGTSWTRQDKGSFEDNCRYVEAQTCNYWLGLVLDEGAQL